MTHAHYRASLASRMRRYIAHLPALLTAEGLRPHVFPDGLPTVDGWVCILRGNAAVVTMAPPLPIRRDGVTVGAIVEVERRGEDWWGRYEATTATTTTGP